VQGGATGSDGGHGGWFAGRRGRRGGHAVGGLGNGGAAVGLDQLGLVILSHVNDPRRRGARRRADSPGVRGSKEP